MNKSLFFDHISDYPDDRETGWSKELQGVTHDDKHWFITQKNRIWKIPAGIDLNGEIDEADPDRGILTAPIPAAISENYDHLGDLDYYKGNLFVPVEGGDRTALIACFDAATLDYIDSALLPQQGNHAPWCAVNPVDGLLHSSPFDNVTKLFAYQFSIVSNRLNLSLDHMVKLKNESNGEFKINEVQGGVFTAVGNENHLYLTSNRDSSRGAHVFRWPEGQRFQTIPIDDVILGFGEEIEGITYWDLDEQPAPGIRGQVHILELDNDIGTDDIKCFKHYRVSPTRFVANRSLSKREVHRHDCIWFGFMKPANKVFYKTLRKALNDGFDGCHYCLREHDTG